MKYIKLLEDSKLWKDQFEENIKGKGKVVGDFYVVNQRGKGEKIDYIPPVRKDILMAKARLAKNKKKQSKKRVYKRRRTQSKSHTRVKTHRGKKVKRITGKKRKINRKRRVSRR